MRRFYKLIFHKEEISKQYSILIYVMVQKRLFFLMVEFCIRMQFDSKKSWIWLHDLWENNRLVPFLLSNLVFSDHMPLYGIPYSGTLARCRQSVQYEQIILQYNLLEWALDYFYSKKLFEFWAWFTIFIVKNEIIWYFFKEIYFFIILLESQDA